MKPVKKAKPTTAEAKKELAIKKILAREKAAIKKFREKRQELSKKKIEALEERNKLASFSVDVKNDK